MSLVEVRVPELGDAKGVNVVDVLIKTGSEIRVEDPLITLETEKASMDVPSPVGGIVASIELKKGDEVSAGTLIATVQVADVSSTPTVTPAPAPAAVPAPAAAARAPRLRRCLRVRPREHPAPRKRLRELSIWWFSAPA